MKTGAVLTGLIALTSIAGAQEPGFVPEQSYAVEVSLENSPDLRLPIYRNAITSLEVVGNYAIGGTSAEAGLSAYLFAVSLSRRRLEMVFPLERILPGQRAIESGFGRGGDGTLFAGTIPDAAGRSGHLLSVRVENGALAVSDLGTPVPGEGIFAVTSDRQSDRIYGISYPSGKFFVFHRTERRTEVYTQTAPDRAALGELQQFVLKPEDYLCRRLAIDAAGRVYGSLPINKLFRFDPERKSLDVLPNELPPGWVRRPLGRVDSWAMGPDGLLYGGDAADGQVFRLDPSTLEITNLGKPNIMPRVYGLAFARDGSLYGVTGGLPGYTHLFRWDPRHGFADYGNPIFTMTEPGLEQGINWRGFRVGSMAASQDGRYIVMGEREALSQLLVFQPAP
jgi:hypothetical protein